MSGKPDSHSSWGSEGPDHSHRTVRRLYVQSRAKVAIAAVMQVAADARVMEKAVEEACAFRRQ